MSKAPTYDEVMIELSRRNYAEYVEYVHRGLYIHGRFTRYISKVVQDFVETDTGHAYDILCLSVPPQHSKSTTITETLPSWIMGKNPNARIFLVAYNVELAKRFLRRNKEKIRDYGQDIFGIQIGAVDNAEELTIGSIGGIKSAGITGGITGNPAEYFIIDDPIKNREEAESDTTRAKIFDEWLNSVKSRLGVGAKVIIIQTRWHKEDLIGKIVETEKNVQYINFPVVCLDDSDELGRKRGEALFPEIKKDEEWWKDFSLSYMSREGSRALNSLYYGKPTNEEGGIFKRKWFIDNLYEGSVQVYHKVIEIDATFKDTKKSDYVAIQVWGKNRNDCYLLEKHKKRLGFVDTVELISEIATRHSDYDEIGVEDKANGSAIVDVLKRKFRAVIPIEPYGSKEARASAISPMVEAGNVHLKSEHYSLIDEAIDFPNSDHDDEVDAMSQSLNRLRNVIAEPVPVKDEDEWDYDDQVNDILAFR